jgi:hypothetical protein
MKIQKFTIYAIVPENSSPIDFSGAGFTGQNQDGTDIEIVFQEPNESVIVSNKEVVELREGDTTQVILDNF